MKPHTAATLLFWGLFLEHIYPPVTSVGKQIFHNDQVLTAGTKYWKEVLLCVCDLGSFSSRPFNLLPTFWCVNYISPHHLILPQQQHGAIQIKRNSLCLFGQKAVFRFFEPDCRISNYISPDINSDVILQTRKTMFLTTFQNTENRVESTKNLEIWTFKVWLTSRFLGMWLNTVLKLRRKRRYIKKYYLC